MRLLPLEEPAVLDPLFEVDVDNDDTDADDDEDAEEVDGNDDIPGAGPPSPFTLVHDIPFIPSLSSDSALAASASSASCC